MCIIVELQIHLFYLIGHYVACLEDKPHEDSLGLDAATCGNELRFINSYLNIAHFPNCTMRTVYMNTYPHLVIICTYPIEIGDEFLLDYGEAYTEAYLKPKPKAEPFPSDAICDVLPFYNDGNVSIGGVDNLHE